MQRRSVSFEDRTAPYRVEPADVRHLSGAARVFCQAFPENVLAALGQGFVEELLASYLFLEGGCCYVCVSDDGEVVGFIVGTEDAAYHRQTLLRTRWPALLRQVLAQVGRSPRLMVRLAQYLRMCLSPSYLLEPRPAKRGSGKALPPASLVMMAVLAEHRRRGIADRLMAAFLDDLEQRGVDRVKLVVSTNNEAALAFYRSRNWKIAGLYPTPDGGSAYRLVYDVG